MAEPTSTVPEAQNDDKRTILYNALKDKYDNLGATQEEFNQKVSDRSKSDALYNQLIKDGYSQLGTADEFYSKLNPTAPEEQATTPGSKGNQATAAYYSDEKQFEQDQQEANNFNFYSAVANHWDQFKGQPGIPEQLPSYNDFTKGLNEQSVKAWNDAAANIQIPVTPSKTGSGLSTSVFTKDDIAAMQRRRSKKDWEHFTPTDERILAQYYAALEAQHDPSLNAVRRNFYDSTGQVTGIAYKLDPNDIASPWYFDPETKKVFTIGYGEKDIKQLTQAQELQMKLNQSMFNQVDQVLKEKGEIAAQKELARLTGFSFVNYDLGTRSLTHKNDQGQEEFNFDQNLWDKIWKNYTEHSAIFAVNKKMKDRFHELYEKNREEDQAAMTNQLTHNNPRDEIITQGAIDAFQGKDRADYVEGRDNDALARAINQMLAEYQEQLGKYNLSPETKQQLISQLAPELYQEVGKIFAHSRTADYLRGKQWGKGGAISNGLAYVAGALDYIVGGGFRDSTIGQAVQAGFLTDTMKLGVKLGEDYRNSEEGKKDQEIFSGGAGAGGLRGLVTFGVADAPLYYMTGEASKLALSGAGRLLRSVGWLSDSPAVETMTKELIAKGTEAAEARQIAMQTVGDLTTNSVRLTRLPLWMQDAAEAVTNFAVQDGGNMVKSMAIGGGTFGGASVVKKPLEIAASPMTLSRPALDETGKPYTDENGQPVMEEIPVQQEIMNQFARTGQMPTEEEKAKLYMEAADHSRSFGAYAAETAADVAWSSATGTLLGLKVIPEALFGTSSRSYMHILGKVLGFAGVEVGTMAGIDYTRQVNAGAIDQLVRQENERRRMLKREHDAASISGYDKMTDEQRDKLAHEADMTADQETEFRSDAKSDLFEQIYYSSLGNLAGFKVKGILKTMFSHMEPVKGSDGKTTYRRVYDMSDITGNIRANIRDQINSRKFRNDMQFTASDNELVQKFGQPFMEKLATLYQKVKSGKDADQSDQDLVKQMISDISELQSRNDIPAKLIQKLLYRMTGKVMPVGLAGGTEVSYDEEKGKWRLFAMDTAGNCLDEQYYDTEDQAKKANESYAGQVQLTSMQSNAASLTSYATQAMFNSLLGQDIIRLKLGKSSQQMEDLEGLDAQKMKIYNAMISEDGNKLETVLKKKYGETPQDLTQEEQDLLDAYLEVFQDYAGNDTHVQDLKARVANGLGITADQIDKAILGHSQEEIQGKTSDWISAGNGMYRTRDEQAQVDAYLAELEKAGNDPVGYLRSIEMKQNAAIGNANDQIAQEANQAGEAGENAAAPKFAVSNQETISGEARQWLNGALQNTPETIKAITTMAYAAEQLKAGNIDATDHEALLKLTQDENADPQMKKMAQLYLNAEEATSGLEAVGKEYLDGLMQDAQQHNDAIEFCGDYSDEFQLGQPTGRIIEVKIQGSDESYYVKRARTNPDGTLQEGMCQIVDVSGEPVTALGIKNGETLTRNLTVVGERDKAKQMEALQGYYADYVDRLMQVIKGGGKIMPGEELTMAEGTYKIKGETIDPQTGQRVPDSYDVEMPDGKTGALTTDQILQLRKQAAQAEIDAQLQSEANQEQLDAEKRQKDLEEQQAAAEAQQKAQEIQQHQFTTYKPGDVLEWPDGTGKNVVWQVLQIDGNRVHLKGDNNQFMTITTEELNRMESDKIVASSMHEGAVITLPDDSQGGVEKAWLVQGIQNGMVYLKSPDGSWKGMTIQEYQNAVRRANGLPEVQEETKTPEKPAESVKGANTEAPSDYQQAMDDLELEDMIKQEEADKKAAEERQKAAEEARKKAGRDKAGTLVNWPVNDEGKVDFEGMYKRAIQDKKEPGKGKAIVTEVYDMLERDGGKGSARMYAMNSLAATEGSIKKLQQEARQISDADPIKMQQQMKENRQKLSQLEAQRRFIRLLLDESGARQVSDKNFSGIIDSSEALDFKEAAPEWFDWMNDLAKQLKQKVNLKEGLTNARGGAINGQNFMNGYIEINTQPFNYHMDDKGEIHRMWEDITPDKKVQAVVDYLASVMGHEYTHTVFKLSPEKAQAFQDLVKKYIGADVYEAIKKKKLDKVGTSYKKEDVDEEVCGDMAGQLFGDANFVRHLLGLDKKPEDQAKKNADQQLKDVKQDEGWIDTVQRHVSDFLDLVLGYNDERDHEYDDEAPVVEGNAAGTPDEATAQAASAEQAVKDREETLVKLQDAYLNMFSEAVDHALEARRAAEEAKVQEEKKEYAARIEAQRKRAEAWKRQKASWDKRITDARNYVASDSEALAYLDESEREAQTAEEYVAENLPEHGLILKSDPEHHIKGIIGETGLKYEDLKGLSYFMGTRENGAKDIDGVAEDIFANMPENIRTQCPDGSETVRNKIIELLSSGKSVDDIRHIVDNRCVSNAISAYENHIQEDKNREQTDLGKASERQEYDDVDLKYSERQGPPPTKVKKVVKLMRVDYDKNGVVVRDEQDRPIFHPLFIDRNDRFPATVWQHADSPSLELLKTLPDGIHLVEINNPEGKHMTFEEYRTTEGGNRLISSGDRKGQPADTPNRADILWAKLHGMRFMRIRPTDEAHREEAIRKYGQPRNFYNFGLSTAKETVAEYALRTGWHAGSQPQMNQIGAGKKGEQKYRNDDEVWVEGYLNAENDYTEENGGLDVGEMKGPGMYKYTTNAVLRAQELSARKQAEAEGNEIDDSKGISWYLSTDFMPSRLLSDAEAHAMIDEHNKEFGDNLEYDLPRRNGMVFDAKQMKLVDPKAVSVEEPEAAATSVREQIKTEPEIAKAKMNVTEPDPEYQDVTTDRRGNVVSAINEETNQAMFSERTFEEGGREQFNQFLGNQIAKYRETKGKQGISEGMARKLRRQMEDMYDEARRIREEGKYTPYNNWSMQEVERDTNGDAIFSVIKANGDYDMNLDFSLLCKKRRTLDAVLSELIARGLIDQADVNMERLAFVNDIIRAYGFETACKLCFVDARRFRTQEVSESFCKMWNDMVKAMIPEGSEIEADSFNFAKEGGVYQPEGSLLKDKENWELSPEIQKHVEEVRNANTNAKGEEVGSNPKSVAYKVWEHLMEHPEDRRLLRVGDFMNTRGFDAVQAQNKRVLSLYNMKKGTGGPKASFGDVQYLNDVAEAVSKNNSGWTPEKAYAVGGVRIQSFSDYVPHLFFDYVQMMGDLAAGKLPAHAYTKEKDFVYQFGLTGLKINMSLVPKAYEEGWIKSGKLIRVPDKDHKGHFNYIWASGKPYTPGLDEDGNYIWETGETFDYDEAMVIQNAKGYRDNCGTIAVGISDAHVRKMLADPNIRMVIPYHKSSLPFMVALHNNIDSFTDYTDEQTTKGPMTIKDSDARKAWVAKNEPSFNSLLRQKKSAVGAAKAYIDWCNENGCTPKFHRFLTKDKQGKYHYTDGYYKMLEDFTCAVPDGKGNVKYRAQKPIQMKFPKENDAFGKMGDLIRTSLESDTKLEEARADLTGDMVDTIEQSMMGNDKGLPERQEGESITDYAKRMADWHKGQKGYEPGIRFSDRENDKSLAGVHNIDDKSIRKALKLGGLANPSVAVIDTNKGSWLDYGRISLILPSSLVDSKTGKNAGTWDRDMWSPLYPPVEYFSNKTSDANIGKLVSSVSDPGLAKEIGYDTAAFVKGNSYGDGLKYLFLQSKGMEPELAHKEFNGMTGQQVADFFGKENPTYEDYMALPEERRMYFNLLQSNNGNEEDAKRIYDKTIEGGKDRWYKMFSNPLNKNTFEFNLSQDRKREASAGAPDYHETLNAAGKVISDNSLHREFEQWADQVVNSLGYDEKFQTGFKPDGTRIYKSNTLANVSAYMKKQGRVNSDDHFGTSGGRILAQLAQRMTSLNSIRKNKDRLSGNQDEWNAYVYRINEASHIFGAKIFDFGSEQDALGYMEDIVAGKSIDSVVAEYNKWHPNAHLELTPEDRQELKEVAEGARNIHVPFFETKFERPVKFEEFKSAVVPNDLGADVVDALKDKGLKIFTYDPGVDGDRERVQQEALGEEGVKFSERNSGPNSDEKNIDPQTVTDNFKNWFGDWEKDPENASKVVDESGRPLVVYHGSKAVANGAFTTFKQGAHGIFFTDKRTASSYGNSSDVVNLKDRDLTNPFEHGKEYSEEAALQYLKDNWWDDARIEEDEDGTKFLRYGDDEQLYLGKTPEEIKDALLLRIHNNIWYETQYKKENHNGGVYPCYLDIKNPLEIDGKGSWFSEIPLNGEKVSADYIADYAKENGYDGVIIRNYRDNANWATNASLCDSYVVFKPEQIKSATDNNGDFDPQNPDIRYSLRNAHFSEDEMKDLEARNEEYNTQLQRLIDDPTGTGFVINMGKPSKILRNAGIIDGDIEVSSRKLKEKADQENHKFDLSELKDLSINIQNPLAVFRSATHVGSHVILTEIKKDNDTFVVAMKTWNKGHKIIINDIRSVHPHRDSNIINWINDGLCDYVHPDFEKEWLDKTKKNYIRIHQSNPDEATKAVLSVAKVVKKLIADDRLLLNNANGQNNSTQAPMFSERNAGPNSDEKKIDPQTVTDNFKRWFGDWQKDPEKASKAVDENGQPRVFYHGSYWDPMQEPAGEAVFDDDLRGTSSGDNGWFGRGHYFAFTAGEARMYGGNVTPAYLNIKKPFYFREELIDQLNGKGYGTLNEVSQDAQLFNTQRLFPDLVKDKRITQYDANGDEKEISIAEYKKIFDDVYKNKKFILKKDDTTEGDDYYTLYADPVVFKADNGAEWTDYAFRMPIYKAQKEYEDPEFDDQAEYTHYYLTHESDSHIYEDEYAKIVSGDIKDHTIYSLPRMRDVYESEEFTQALKDRGYDGIFQSKVGDEAVVFKPEQIKSATDNNGDFDPNNPDIRYSERSESVFENPTKEEGFEPLSEEQTKRVKSANFKRWFGDWEKDPENASKVVDENGMPLIQMHATGKDKKGFTVFNTQNDNEANNNIGSHFGISAAKEISEGGNWDSSASDVYRVYLNIKNPYDTFDWFGQDDAYPLVEAMKLADEADTPEAKAIIDDICKSVMKAEGNEWVKDLYDQYKHGDHEDAAALVEEEYLDGGGSEKLYAGIRKLLKMNGYDGIKYDNDLEGEGECWIALEPNQIKSADTTGEMANNGEFDPQNPDIRYSERDNEIARGRVIAELKDMIDDKLVNSVRKSDLNRMLSLVSNAKPGNLYDSVKKAEAVVRTVRTEQLGHELDNLLKLKVQDRNSKNMSVAKNVDNETRQIVEHVRGKFYGVMDTEEDKAIRGKYRENYELRREINLNMLAMDRGQYGPEGSADYDTVQAHINDLKQQVEANNQTIRNLREQRKATIMAQVQKSSADLQTDIDAMIAKMTEHCEAEALGDHSKPWTKDDIRQLTETEILKARMDIEKVDEDIQRLRQERTNAESAGERRGYDELIWDQERERLEKVSALVDKVRGLIQGGKQSLYSQKQAEAEHKTQLIRGTLGDIRGGKQLPAESDKRPGRGKPNKWNAFFTGPLKTFEYMASAIDENHMSGDGWFYKYFMKSKNGVMEAHNQFLTGYKDAMRTLRDKVTEITGKKADKFADDGRERVEDHGVTMLKENVDEFGNVTSTERVPLHNFDSYRPDTFSKNNAMYLYMVWQMPDGRAKMEAQGFDEISIEEMKEFMGDQRVKIADYIQKEYLPALFPKYQAKYTEMYGTPMADIPNYVPLRINGEVVKHNSNMFDGEGNMVTTLSSKTGSMINRTTNLKPLRLDADAFDVIQEHVFNNEEFTAYANVRKDLDAILSSNAIKNQLNANQAGLYQDLAKAAAIAVRSEHHDPVDGVEQALIAATKGIVGANIAFRWGTALKQTTSFPAFWAYRNDMGYQALFLKHLVKDYGQNLLAIAEGSITLREKMLNDLEAGKWTPLNKDFEWAYNNVPSFRDRVTTGNMGMDILTPDGSKGIRAWLSQKGMGANQMVDAITCLTGIKAIYEWNMGKARKIIDAEYAQKEQDLRDEIAGNGMTPEAKAQKLQNELNNLADEKQKALDEAHRVAVNEADISYNSSQQSSHEAFLAPIQTNPHLLQKQLMAYKNSPVSYARHMMTALQDYQKLIKNRQGMIDAYKSDYMMLGKSEEEAEKEAKKQIGIRARQDLSRLSIFGFILGAIWVRAGQGLYGFFTDDEQDEAMVSAESVPSFISGGGMPGYDILNNLASGKTDSPFLLWQELADIKQKAPQLWKQVQDDQTWGSYQLGSFIFQKASRIYGVDTETIANMAFGLEEMIREGYSQEDIALNLEYMINLSKSNRKSTAKVIYKDMDLDDQLKIVLKAGKIFDDDDPRRWLPGAKKMTKERLSEIYSELAAMRIANKDLKNQPMTDKEMNDIVSKLSKTDDCEQAFNGTDNETLRKKILNRQQEIDKNAAWSKKAQKQKIAEVKQSYAERHQSKTDAKKAQSDLTKGKAIYKLHIDFKAAREDQEIDTEWKRLQEDYASKTDDMDANELDAFDKEHKADAELYYDLKDIRDDINDLKIDLAYGDTDMKQTLNAIAKKRTEALKLIQKSKKTK